MNGQTLIVSLQPETLSWEQALQMFRLRGRAGGNSAATADNYRWILEPAIEYLRKLGAGRPAAVTSIHVRQFLEDSRSKGLSSSSVDARYRQFKTFFRCLLADGLLERDPMAGIQRPKIETKPPKAFKPEEFLKMLGQLNAKTSMGKRDLALLCLIFDSGARISGVLGLRIQDIDITQDLAMVRGKGGKFRNIGWGEKTRRALLEWLRCRQDAKPEDPLFCDLYGGPLSRNAVRLRMKRLTKKAGIAAPRLGAHALRHGCAVSLLRGGADLETLRRVLGHSRLSTTQIYLQGFSDDDALEKAREVGVVDRLGPLPGERKRVKFKQ